MLDPAMHTKHVLPSLSLLLRTRIVHAGSPGELAGRLYDIAVGTGSDAGRVAGIVIKNRAGLSWVSATEVTAQADGSLQLGKSVQMTPLRGDESFVLLRQDLLDRQIIDVHGRKVVRVNDVDLQWFGEPGEPADLRVSEVEVGLRGAARRLLLGLLPNHTIASLTERISARVIPWDFVDLIEADPARRVKLKLSHERLAQLHPSDIAEILDDLAPADREAIFATLDEGVAAHALEEADPSLQKSLIDSISLERTASIVEEMDPEAAADMLAELPAEHSESILEEMGEEERQEVEELLEFREDSAAGRMTTDYVQVPFTATVADAVQALRDFEGTPETVTEIYLVEEPDSSGSITAGTAPEASAAAGPKLLGPKRPGPEQARPEQTGPEQTRLYRSGGEQAGSKRSAPKLKGIVPLARLLLAQPGTRLELLAERRFACVHKDADEREVAELFDKYNLRALPVIDGDGVLVGVVEADHVIAFLRDAK